MEESLSLEYPSMSRRQLLNFLTGAVVATTASAALYPAAKFLVSPAGGSKDGPIIASDKLGNPILASQILAEPSGTRALVAGLAGEPTYLTVAPDATLDSMGIVDNCTHLGCTFPWNPIDNQFQCPCHGSRYSCRWLCSAWSCTSSPEASTGKNRRRSDFDFSLDRKRPPYRRKALVGLITLDS